MSGVIAGIGVGISAAAAIASHVQANQQAADTRGHAGDAANAAKAAGTAQKATAADTSALNPGGTPAAAGVNSGPASTLLTGSGGVANAALNLGGGAGLGGNTLLGS
ncbi:hypothetical protein [Paraburkholderia sartisoli]|uniref:Uncharacterized protein n=1 Tax=Paraburkholderia sartisoli TaxID=83784 RepID=A0A1H4HUM2_9BURK|nr:hypothetical protein [Paraburkholderia sartisoli]SEB24782.1 hypothetical protein SAMN05192564_11531 [Paraburkholderia sartisoli]